MKPTFYFSRKLNSTISGTCAATCITSPLVGEGTRCLVWRAPPSEKISLTGSASNAHGLQPLPYTKPWRPRSFCGYWADGPNPQYRAGVVTALLFATRSPAASLCRPCLLAFGRPTVAHVAKEKHEGPRAFCRRRPGGQNPQYPGARPAKFRAREDWAAFGVTCSVGLCVNPLDAAPRSRACSQKVAELLQPRRRCSWICWSDHCVAAGAQAL